MRAESVKRLQIGAMGLGTMLLIVGLVSIITDRAQQSEDAAVPDAVSTVPGPETTENPQDPLVDAGVMPEVAPSETSASGGNTAQTAPPQPGQPKQ